MQEMQRKMEVGLNELEDLKKKHHEELMRIDSISREKIARIEDDYNKKVADLGNRFNEELLAR